MIGFYNKEKRILSNKTMLQCFLKNLQLRQSGHLVTVPKILFTRNDWSHRIVLQASLCADIERTACISQIERDIIIPVVDKTLLQMENKITDCDAVIFHSLPLPKNIDGCVQSLDGMTARILSINNIETHPVTITQIDVAFTPVWFKKGENTMTTIKEYQESLKKIMKKS